MIRPAAVLALVLNGTALEGQITGSVVDDFGQPLPDAIVVVIGHGELLDEISTDRAGDFRSPARLSDIQRLSVHYVGYATSLVDRSVLSASEVRVVMTSLPVPLPGIVARIARDICSERDDPTARALWERASSSYSDDTALRGGGMSGLGQTDYVRSDALGSFVPGDLVEMTTGWSGALEGPYPLHLESRIEEYGYAWPRSEGDRKSMPTGRRHLNWAYPEFERRHAYHFAAPSFGRRHTLHVMGESGGGTEVAFCPVPADRASMMGRVTIAADTTFAEARWSIETDDPREDAGGEVVFADAFDAAGARHLVAARGTFWRHNGRPVPYPDLPRSYTQIVRVARAWIVCLDATSPRTWTGRPGEHCEG